VFAVQGEILRAIGEALQLQLETALHHRAENDVEAYGLFLLGLQHLRQRTEKALRNAIDSFQRAIAIDPSMAGAHSALSLTRVLLAMYGWDEPRLAMPAAADSAHAALAVDPKQSDALVTLSFVAFYYDWNPGEAERRLESALAVAPSNSVAYNWYAVFLLNRGRFAEAERCLREAAQLDPMALTVQHNIVWLRILEGRQEEAIALCQHIARVDPAYRRIGYFLSWAYANLGQWTLAEDAVREMAALESVPEMAQLGCCYAALGNRAGAGRILDRLDEIARERYVSPMERCYVYSALGDLDQAFACLEAAARERAPTLLFFHNDARLNPLRSDPRFARIVPSFKG
jgi:tetratricopeptide (TPR) repeat protein